MVIKLLQSSASEIVCLCLIIVANVLYGFAAVTHAWFKLPPHSFYGLWWVKFCDYLHCQIIPAFYTDEPAWYHVMQCLSVAGWVTLFFAMIMLISNRLDCHLPIVCRTNRKLTVSAICLLSVSTLSASILMFYTKLEESSPKEMPQVSWSAELAGLACLLELIAGLMLLASS